MLHLRRNLIPVGVCTHTRAGSRRESAAAFRFRGFMAAGEPFAPLIDARGRRARALNWMLNRTRLCAGRIIADSRNAVCPRPPIARCAFHDYL